MADLSRGAAEFRALSLRLKTAGSGELRREVDGAIGDAVQPLLGEIRTGLEDYMPKRYAGVLASDLQLRTLKSGGSVRIRGTAPTGRRRSRMVGRLDSGILWHPLFGNRKRWYDQGPLGGGMRPGWFSDPAERSAPQFREAILQALRNIADQVTRG